MEYNKKQQVDDHLLSLLGSTELVRGWWINPNRYWSGKKPEDIWEKDPQSVIDYVYRYCYGR